MEVRPPEQKDVLYEGNYYKKWKKDHKNAKLHKEFSQIVAERHLKHVTSPTQLANVHVIDSETIRALQTRQKPGASVLARLFKANLTAHETRLTPSEFV